MRDERIEIRQRQVMRVTRMRAQPETKIFSPVVLGMVATMTMTLSSTAKLHVRGLHLARDLHLPLLFAMSGLKFATGGYLSFFKCTVANMVAYSGSRNGQRYDDDIVFERETGNRRALEGVRRSEHREEEDVRELAIIDSRDRGRRFEAEKSKKERMWTEITKDLVSEEAIKEVGYEYEGTEQFYYVMEYLRYVRYCSLLSPSAALPNHGYL